MPRISGQMLVYLAIGAVLVLVGLNSIRGEKSASSSFTAPAAGAAGGVTTPDSSGSQGFSVSGGTRKLIVDVAGAVRRPGVYRFEQGDRVLDAIARAGGLTAGAMEEAINRAATLSDGQQVVVPSAAATGGSASPAAGGTAADAPVSLGSATQAQLEEIDGIGPVTAQKIIEFRDSKGGLASVDALDQVSGIGPVTMESLRAALSP